MKKANIHNTDTLEYDLYWSFIGNASVSKLNSIFAFTQNKESGSKKSSPEKDCKSSVFNGECKESENSIFSSSRHTLISEYQEDVSVCTFK